MSFFVRWLRDHVHTLKGMKYYAPNLESGIDLYADHQRNDGMIWDNVYSRYFQKNWWEKRFAYGGFYQSIEPGDFEFKRIPVENDVEYLFIEGIYYTWKATGSDEWMKSVLDKALLAVQYATTNEYRWSEKYQLLKRGYTIDTWDFQTTEDAEIAGDDIMVVFPDKTRFGVMFGDNTGMYAACHYLAEMLNYVGRSEEAVKVRELGDGLKRRVDDLAWNGSHYTHHIPEDPTIKRDLGVAEASQVSLSNAYSLNRMIDHSQAKAIIETYQRIREEMPATSQGEWYTIYPPFEQGFGRWDSSNKWEYMNGGVTSIVAGELAHGAFEHGFEDYGADILRRVRELAAKSNDYLECTYRGSIPEVPERNFTQLDLSRKKNGVYPNPQATFEGKDFFAGVDEKGVKSFRDVPFQIGNEQSENTALIFSRNGLREIEVPINDTAHSIYFLHNRENGQVAGTATLQYKDGSESTEYLTQDKVGFWWSEDLSNDQCKLAWRSDDLKHFAGIYVFGLNNPYPKKEISKLVLRGTDDVPTWRINGITLSDHPVYFQPSIVSHGIPANWGAAAVMYALVEGLIGIKDEGVAFDKTLISPRWSTTEVKTAETTIKYEASDAYSSYKYEIGDRTVRLTFTGSGSDFEIRLLLPGGVSPKSATMDGKEMDIVLSQIESSTYLETKITAPGVHELIVNW